jgi:hypothetical protein
MDGPRGPKGLAPRQFFPYGTKVAPLVRDLLIPFALPSTGSSRQANKIQA